MAGTRLFVFARHAESTANVAEVVSSDPAHPVWLTSRGKIQARQLGVQLARETVNDALLRYGRSLGRLLSRAEHVTLVVLHEFALRRIVQAARGLSSPTEGFANAVPYFLDERAVERAAAGLESMARTPRPESIS